MADPQSSPPSATLPPPRGSRLNTLLLVLLTLFTGVLAADRVNDAVVRWRYERFVAEYRDAQSRLKEIPIAKYDAMLRTWDEYEAAFRSRGFPHPNRDGR